MSRRAEDYADFRSWLADRGLSTGTIDVYARDLRLANGSSGLIARLRDNDLAPKTRHHVLAAGRSWANFIDDTKLTKKLDEIRLPPARRQSARVPITRDHLFDVIDELNRASYLSDSMRATLGMMACRGFRCGDVLRLRKRELVSARTSGTLAYEAKGRKRLEFKVLKTYRKWLVMLADQPGSWDRVDELIAPDAGEKGLRKAAAKAVGRALHVLGKKIKITNLHPHRLRRTYAVEYLRTQKNDPEALMRLVQHMGWSSIMVAAEYVDHARSDVDDYAEKIFDRDL